MYPGQLDFSSLFRKRSGLLLLWSLVHWTSAGQLVILKGTGRLSTFACRAVVVFKWSRYSTWGLRGQSTGVSTCLGQRQPAHHGRAHTHVATQVTPPATQPRSRSVSVGVQSVHADFAVTPNLSRRTKTLQRALVSLYVFSSTGDGAPEGSGQDLMVPRGCAGAGTFLAGAARSNSGDEEAGHVFGVFAFAGAHLSVRRADEAAELRSVLKMLENEWPRKR